MAGTSWKLHRPDTVEQFVRELIAATIHLKGTSALLVGQTGGEKSALSVQPVSLDPWDGGIPIFVEPPDVAFADPAQQIFDELLASAVNPATGLRSFELGNAAARTAKVTYAARLIYPTSS
jgi:hypothetical protein